MARGALISRGVVDLRGAVGLREDSLLFSSKEAIRAKSMQGSVIERPPFGWVENG